MLPPNALSTLDIPSRYLENKTGKASKFRPNADYFTAALSKVREILNPDTSAMSERTPRITSGSVQCQPRNKSVEGSLLPKLKPPTRQNTIFIQDSEYGARKDAVIGRGTREKLVRVKATMVCRHGLNRDKEFLELLKTTTRSKTKVSLKLKALTQDALNFVETCKDYWRQQNPDTKGKPQILPGQYKDDDPDRLSGSPSKARRQVERQLRRIDRMMKRRDFPAVIVTTSTLMSDVKRMERRLPGKESIFANCCSLLGDAYFALGEIDKALTFHMQDLHIANENAITVAKARAFENLGRVYTNIGKYQRAIQMYSNRLVLDIETSTKEKAWMFYEMGDCYLKLRNHIKARECSEKALSVLAGSDEEERLLKINLLLCHAILMQPELYGHKAPLQGALAFVMETENKRENEEEKEEDKEDEEEEKEEIKQEHSVSDKLRRLRDAIEDFKSSEKDAKDLLSLETKCIKSVSTKGRKKPKYMPYFTQSRSSYFYSHSNAKCRLSNN